jgi:hypothetical protein
VLVKTLACGICGSDLHALKHTEKLVEASRRSGGAFTMDLTRGIVMGHEFCAEVVDHGLSTKKTLKAGTRVCSMPVLIRSDGVQTVGYSNDNPGGYGEFMRLTEGLLLEVPNGLSTERAALTEPMAVGLHAITDRVVLLVNDGSIINVGQSLSTMNTTKYYKFVDDGLVVDDTQSVIFTNTNVRLKPLSVANVTGTRDGSDNLIIEWDDRLRFGHAWGDSEFPTDEPELEFEVDVMDGSTVVRTITTTSTTASYTAAEQTTDFGSPQNPLTVKIYKISSRVGRGYVKEASI